MTKKTNKYNSFEEIRKALSEIDELRANQSLTKDEIALLEGSALSLRELERLLINKEQKALASSIKVMEEELKTLTKSMRERVSKMNKASKALDITEKVIAEVLKVLKIIDNIF